MIDKIDVIMMEWHDGQAEYLKKLLKDSGFRFVLSNEYCVDFGKCYAWK